MTLEPDSGTKVRLVEKITCSPYWVPFSIIDHPRYSGPVDAIAERISSLETKITA